MAAATTFYAFYNFYDNGAWREHKSPTFDSKAAMWAHIQNIKHHAQANGNIRINNLYVHQVEPDGTRNMIWVMFPERYQSAVRMLDAVAASKSQRVRDC